MFIKFQPRGTFQQNSQTIRSGIKTDIVVLCIQFFGNGGLHERDSHTITDHVVASV
jgi:hypothetical protein